MKETGVTFVDTKLHRTFACAYVQPFLFAFVELEENGGGHESAALLFFYGMICIEWAMPLPIL